MKGKNYRCIEPAEMNNLKSLKLKKESKNRQEEATSSQNYFADDEAVSFENPEVEAGKTTPEADFFSFLAHNIRNPFGTLLGFSEMLEMDFDEMEDEEKKFFVRQINSTAKNLYDAFENFVNWSYITNEKYQTEFERLDLYEIVSGEVQKAKNKATKKNLTLAFENTDENFVVYGNRNLLSLAVKNLLSNAIKYSPGKTTVSVSFTAGPDLYSVHVKDEGNGIDPSVNILTYEGVMKTANGNKEKSAGLGLILTTRILEIHNGKLWYESTPQGSTFSFSLPKLK